MAYFSTEDFFPHNLRFFLCTMISRNLFIPLKMSGIMALGSLSLIISLSGCSLVPTVHTPIHKSERGTVALRTFSDQDFQATHPKVLEPTHGQSPAGVTCPGTKGNVSNTYDWGSYNRLKLFQQIKLNFSPRF